MIKKLSLLSLSFMLVSSFAISSGLPQMAAFYSNYPIEQVELLASLPSFMIIVTLLSNGILSRYLSEQIRIVTGLLLMTLAGMAPFFIQDYAFVFVTRLLLGVGIGLINALAISILSEHYDGKERIQMLGFRGSAEVVGSAVMTLIVGQLLKIGWQWAFLVYGLGFIILFLYLFFVPKKAKESAVSQESPKAGKLSTEQIVFAVLLALLAGWTICINTAITLRIPTVVTQMEVAGRLGTSTEASLVLSIQQLVGIVAGLVFSSFLTIFKDRLLFFMNLGLALSLLALSLSTSIVWMSVSVIGTGFFYSLILNAIFSQISQIIPLKLVNSATAIVLVGCNLGGSLAPYVLKGFSYFTSSNYHYFAIFGVSCLLLATLLFFKGDKSNDDRKQPTQ